MRQGVRQRLAAAGIFGSTVVGRPAGKAMGIRQQITVIALALGLGGCVASKAPLFDPASAVTPVAAGSFEIQEEKGGTWTRSSTGTLALEGQVYAWKVDDDEETQRFSLYDVGGGYFVIMHPGGGRADTIFFSFM